MDGESWTVPKYLWDLQYGSMRSKLIKNYLSSETSIRDLTLQKRLPATEAKFQMQFNDKGDILAGSNAANNRIELWEWENSTSKPLLIKVKPYQTTSFMKFKWMPYSSHLMAVCSPREKQLLMLDLCTQQSDVLVEPLFDYIDGHDVFLMQVNREVPHVLLSNRRKFNKIVTIDIREGCSQVVTTIVYNEHNWNAFLNCMKWNPHNSNEFIVGGDAGIIYFYDMRFALKPHTAKNISRHDDIYNSIKNMEFNYNGDELIINSDHKIILMEKKGWKVSLFLQDAGLVWANFHGPRSEFIMRGWRTPDAEPSYSPYTVQGLTISNKKNKSELRGFPLQAERLWCRGNNDKFVASYDRYVDIWGVTLFGHSELRT